MIKTISKRLIAILLTLAMVLGSVPAFFQLEVEAAQATGSVILTNYQKQQRQLAIDTLLYGVRGNNYLTVEEKALILHDRLVAWCEYDVNGITDGHQRWEADGVFINRIAVCLGYALAYQELLQAVGIPNIVCSSVDLNHAWNILLINGQYYHVDCTWDDPIDDQVGRVGHLNFLVSDARFREENKKDCHGSTYKQGHTAYDFVDYHTGKAAPACTSTKYDYYYWQDSSSEFQTIGQYCYYVDNRTGDIRRTSDRASVLDISAYWDGYSSSFSRLDSDGNYLYYSRPDSIWRYNVNTGSNNWWHSLGGSYHYEFMLETGVAFIGVKASPWGGTNTCTKTESVRIAEYNGLYEYRGWWWLLESNNYTGLVPHCGGLYYVRPSDDDSYVDYNYTGLCHYKETTYYVVNGRVDDTYNGLYTWNGKTYCIKYGYVDTTATGVKEYGGKYYYIQNGVVDTTKNGFVDGYLFTNGQLNTTYTGLYNNNGTWTHVSKGIAQPTYTGLSTYNGVYHLMEKGKLNTTYTGLYKYSGTWYYLTKGKVNATFTGLTKYGSKTYYVTKGKLNTAYTGLYKYNGKWYYLAKGVVDSSYTGLAKYDGDSYLVKKGQKNSSYDGLYKYNGNWYYLKNGKWQKTYTGLVKKGDAIYYVKNGKRSSKYTGLMKYGSRWYHVAKGKVDKKYTGISKYKNDSYLVKKGKKNTTIDGMYKVGSTWYYLKNGKVDTSRTGLYKKGSTWYYLKKGKLSTGTTGLVKKGKTYYYVKKGKVDPDFTGIAKKGSDRYYVKKGKINTSTTNLIKYNEKRYYVKKGKVQSSFTGLYKVNSKTWYFVDNGVVDTEYKGLVTTYSDNASWLVRNGKVDFNYYGTWYQVNGNSWKKYYVYGGKVYY